MKLYFFRNQVGRYGFSVNKPSSAQLGTRFDLKIRIEINGEPVLLTLSSKPRGLPSLQPGECVPVELVVKPKKKARKG